MTAQVDLDATSFTDNDSITLVTNNDNVVFYVNSRETPDRVAQYKKGQTYTFNIFIRAIDPPEEFFPEYAIWSKSSNRTCFNNNGCLNSRYYQRRQNLHRQDCVASGNS